MMYDPALELPVLRLLDRWDRLPYSDLQRMLEPFQRPRLRMDLIKDLEWEGSVLLRSAGDELVIEITPRGRARLAGSRPNPTPPTPESAP